MKSVILFVIFILSICSLRADTFYFSMTDGNDANEGDSPTNAKKTIEEAISLMTSGNTILFKRGDAWYLKSETIDISGRSNFSIGAYGTGNRPIIAGLISLPPETWVHHGGGIWKCNTRALSIDPTGEGFMHIHRVFVNGVSKINLAMKKDNTNSLSSLNSTDEYFNEIGPRTLYLYTGSTVNPPQNARIVAGRALAGQEAGKPVLTATNGTHHVTIKHIDFRGGSKRNVIYITTPGWNITFDSCNIGWAATSGIYVGNAAGTAGSTFSDIAIRNCIIDKGWTAAENNIRADTVLSGDGIFFAHGIEGGIIYRNTITNWGHSAIQMSCIGPNTLYGVHRVKIDRNDISAGASGYMHAIDISGIPNKVTNNIIKRNFLHDFTTMCHFGGRNNFYFSNIIARVNVTTIGEHSKQPMGADLFPWYGRDPWNSSVSHALEARDNYIFNNTFYDTDAYSLWLGQSGTNTYAVNNKINNNIMMNWGDDLTYDPNPPADVALRVMPEVEGTVVRNNNFWRASTPTGTVVRYRSGPLRTAAQLNTAAECDSCSGNTQLAPVFGTEWDLTSSSPTELKTGGLPYTSFLPSFFLTDRQAELIDFAGVPLRTVEPSIGARQY